MSKHTPGPWHIANGCQIRSSKDQIAKAWMMRGGEGLANARLISAAPELLEALEELVTDMVIAQGNMRDAAKHDPRWEGCADAIQPRIDAARAAIAKARGN